MSQKHLTKKHTQMKHPQQLFLTYKEMIIDVPLTDEKQ